MAPRKSKVASRKIRDKWRAKEWYKVHAPRMFNEVEIGDTPSADPSNLIGRTVDVTVQELSGDFSKSHIKIKFKVTSVDGHVAKTSFVGHDLTSEYVRRLTRRKKTKTDHVVDVVTKDGFTVRVKPMSISETRIQTSQEEAIRRIMNETLVEMGKEMTLSDIVKGVVSGDVARNIARACRVVMPIKRIEIRKTHVMMDGEGEPESIIEVEETEEESEETEEESEEEEPEEEAEEPEEEPEAEAEESEEAEA